MHHTIQIYNVSDVHSDSLKIILEYARQLIHYAMGSTQLQEIVPLASKGTHWQTVGVEFEQKNSDLLDVSVN